VIDDLGADVGELTVGESFANREDSPADAIARLEHDHLVAGSLDLGRGDQARESGADDEHLHARRTLASKGSPRNLGEASDFVGLNRLGANCSIGRDVPPSSARSAATSPITG